MIPEVAYLLADWIGVPPAAVASSDVYRIDSGTDISVACLMVVPSSQPRNVLISVGIISHAIVIVRDVQAVPLSSCVKANEAEFLEFIYILAEYVAEEKVWHD